jgi:stage III sporulation protein AG
LGDERDLWSKIFGTNRRKDQKLFLIALGILGILMLVFGSLGGKPTPQPTDTKVTSPSVTPAETTKLKTLDEEEYLAKRLETMLGQINGVGAVDVSIRLAGSTVSEYAVNVTTGKRVTDENEPEGARRVTTDQSESGQLVVVRAEQGYEIPVMEREISPAVAGVLVVAEGARDPRIKAQLFQATQTALGVEAHKILVVPKKL